jgi:hypothetical protein
MYKETKETYKQNEVVCVIIILIIITLIQ